MGVSWSFGKKIGFGFAAVVGLTILTSVVGAIALSTAIEKSQHTLSVVARDALQVKELDGLAEQHSSGIRGILLLPDKAAIDGLKDTTQAVLDVLDRLKNSAPSPEFANLLDQIRARLGAYNSQAQLLVAARQSGASPEELSNRFDQSLRPLFRQLRDTIDTLGNQQDELLQQEQRASKAAADFATWIVIVIAVIAAILGIALAVWLTRTLNRQIGSAVQHIQSSSAELQSAANQQAAGSKEQATAMSEITVTVQQLLASAKQIADSAQRVARIAADTALAARSGDQTVLQTQEAITSIRRQVDLIVTHMLDLGKKSQQIGGILDIVNELAEQTNILAINATIEAAGAGEIGRRFGTVAEEIRKLADRVGVSTKEIRGLIDEVRSAVHTTIMATESGSKTVDAGAARFSEVASGFQRIASMVDTTTEASKEIGLSTQQQSSAVEQVNVAIANVAQAAKESETSARQTVQTATDLAKLSHELAQLVQQQARMG